MLIFDQDLERFTEMAGVGIGTDRFLQGVQHLVAARFFRFGYVVDHAAFAHRAGARAVAGDVHLVELEIAEQIDGAFKGGVVFATEADDDVGVDRHIRDDRAHAVDQGAVFGIRIATAHLRQNGIVAGLDRHLDVFADLGQIAHRLQDAIRHVVWMAGEKANAPQAVDRMHGA